MNLDDRSITATKEDIELLVLEISDVKGILKELSGQILRIERRLNVLLPKSEKQTRKVSRRLDTNEARRTIGHLTECAKRGEEIEIELRRMTVKGELGVLARELGMTNAKLPPKDTLVRRISTRLRQSASVSAGIEKGAQPQR